MSRPATSARARAMPTAPPQAPRRSPRLAGRASSTLASSTSGGDARLWFCLLSLYSVSMTCGNKFLMSSPVFAGQTQLVVTVQNAIAVIALGLASACGAFQITAIDSKQLLFYCWDAAVLVVQIFTSFEALRHLPVSATTVVRALAIPVVAWVELLVLGATLTPREQLWSCVVVAGAIAYAYDDLHGSSATAVGYAWALANLLAFVSNSVLDRLMMSRSSQSAGGMALLTQAISIPISVGQGVAVDGLTASSAALLLRSLDVRTATALCVTGAVAGLLGNCYAQVYKRASATSVSIAGNCNKALSVLASAALFGSRLSRGQAIGLCVCLGGAFGYSLEGAKRKDAAKDVD
jgi:drug/metabolite transporter (DMT)-like permease